ncbi:neuropeptide Y receptor type 5 isoform X2 [Piliocolobus tephrosceles]|uniref:neuropeptide Y receptor type 5 isoform X2 n=1 Tax=Piliocolobus tephrosceles TaxID=591936 RepID=UPI000C2A259E|nr:neuropeptide Y receptor type 5 isoform X2 [Piliocolobus tephrosceles]
MDLELDEYYNKTLATENNTATTRNSDFPVWDDYKSSVDDLQYFLIGLYTFIGPQVKLSGSHKWSYSFIKKHRRRYSKKKACVLPAPERPSQENHSRILPENFGSVRSQLSSSSKFIPGVPTCFEIKPEENSDVRELRVKRSVTRIKKRSRSVFYRLTILILVFAVSWMPLHLFHVVTDFNDNLISNRHFKLVYCICHLLGMMSCCLNPILYGFLNNGIKADLMSLIHCLHM